MKNEGLQAGTPASGTKSRSEADAVPPGFTISFREGIGYQMRTTHRLIQKLLGLRLEEYGINIGMWYFLRALWLEDGLTQRELSDRTGTQEPSTLSALVQMEKRGLIRRQRNTTDKRKINVFLTEEGRALQAVLMPVALDVLRATKVGMSPREVEVLLTLLEQIQANVTREIEAYKDKG